MTTGRQNAAGNRGWCYPIVTPSVPFLSRHGQNKNFHEAVKPEMWYNSGVFKMCMMNEIAAKRDEIYAIARKHKVEWLWGFLFVFMPRGEMQCQG